MEDWEKEIQGLLHTDQQRLEERNKKARAEAESQEQDRKKAIDFVGGTPLRALKELESGLQKQGLHAFAARADTGTAISMKVERQGEGLSGLKPFEYTIEAGYAGSELTIAVTWKFDMQHGSHLIERGGQILTAGEITKEDIIRDFMEAYRNTFGR